jgi:hypothetical protein
MSDLRGVTEVNGIREYQYFAGSECRAAENPKLFIVCRPYDRGLCARVASGGRPKATPVVHAAGKAFPLRPQSTQAERARPFFKGEGEPR